ncbi:putative signal transduction protein [Desulfamplus magnetovallimortis]|uniref:Putative signal transduction protein n=1 Tax=Desulfamplus magnetovallimortis TaxID=1246637 RepID=A0A1W1HEP3_9BACT|nr:putative signal transduction protein [Desulfamplus magnetovallimortis]
MVNKIIDAASDDSTTTDELADIITYDQGMTNKLLKLSNSIYYSQRSKVDTVKRAIAVIGFDEIMGIALGMNVMSVLTGRDSGLSLDVKALWLHCIGCATAAKEIASRIHPEISGKIFIPALLHDMGKVILSIYFKDEYHQVRTLAIDQQKPLFRVERQIFNLDHAILSGLLMKRWQFPDSILYPSRYHHNPSASPPAYRDAALIINLSDYLCHKARIGHSGNPVPVTVKNSTEKAGISEVALRLILDQLRYKQEQIKEFFDITTG